MSPPSVRLEAGRAPEVLGAQTVDLAAQHLPLILEEVDEPLAFVRSRARIVERKAHRDSSVIVGGISSGGFSPTGLIQVGEIGTC